jgi:serine/threonine protein kinase
MTTVGTPLYVAPEIMRNDTYDEKVDSFSFGVVLFACLMIRPQLFDVLAEDLRKDTGKSSARGIGTGMLGIKFEAGWRPSIPDSVYPSLGKLIKECWDSEPANRPTFEQIVDVMRGAITQEVYSLPEPSYASDSTSLEADALASTKRDMENKSKSDMDTGRPQDKLEPRQSAILNNIFAAPGN